MAASDDPNQEKRNQALLPIKKLNQTVLDSWMSPCLQCWEISNKWFSLEFGTKKTGDHLGLSRPNWKWLYRKLGQPDEMLFIPGQKGAPTDLKITFYKTSKLFDIESLSGPEDLLEQAKPGGAVQQVGNHLSGTLTAKGVLGIEPQSLGGYVKGGGVPPETRMSDYLLTEASTMTYTGKDLCETPYFRPLTKAALAKKEPPSRSLFFRMVYMGGKIEDKRNAASREYHELAFVIAQKPPLNPRMRPLLGKTSDVKPTPPTCKYVYVRKEPGESGSASKADVAPKKPTQKPSKNSSGILEGGAGPVTDEVNVLRENLARSYRALHEARNENPIEHNPTEHEFMEIFDKIDMSDDIRRPYDVRIPNEEERKKIGTFLQNNESHPSDDSIGRLLDIIGIEYWMRAPLAEECYGALHAYVYRKRQLVTETYRQSLREGS